MDWIVTLDVRTRTRNLHQIYLAYLILRLDSGYTFTMKPMFYKKNSGNGITLAVANKQTVVIVWMLNEYSRKIRTGDFLLVGNSSTIYARKLEIMHFYVISPTHTSYSSQFQFDTLVLNMGHKA